MAGPRDAQRINSCWCSHIWAAVVCQREPTALKCHISSALANKTKLTALRNHRGLIRCPRDAHPVVWVARGVFFFPLRAAREEFVLSTIQAAAYTRGPGAAVPRG